MRICVSSMTMMSCVMRSSIICNQSYMVSRSLAAIQYRHMCACTTSIKCILLCLSCCNFTDNTAFISELMHMSYKVLLGPKLLELLLQKDSMHDRVLHCHVHMCKFRVPHHALD